MLESEDANQPQDRREDETQDENESDTLNGNSYEIQENYPRDEKRQEDSETEERKDGNADEAIGWSTYVFMNFGNRWFQLVPMKLMKRTKRS